MLGHADFDIRFYPLLCDDLMFIFEKREKVPLLEC